MSEQIYWGDLHNHCNISYGHGSLNRALKIAREHLDFCAVTGHAAWPDMPRDEARYGEIIRYHQAGFEKLRASWPYVVEQVNQANIEHRFVTLHSYEWHSLKSGDHNIYHLGASPELVLGASLNELKRLLDPTDTMILPHHIGYGPGSRGIDWHQFDAGHSPVVEIFSSHGSSERDGGPYPIYHTMGPRVHEGTVAHGLALGKHFGFTAGSDHHAGFPGHYGAGRTAVYAPELTREAIWQALRARRCYAVTGDKIQLDFRINGAPMGSALPSTPRREIAINVRGCDTLERIDIIKKNRPFARYFGPEPQNEQLRDGIYKIRVEWGWGEKDALTVWDGQVSLQGTSKLLGVEPCFRGESVLDPRDEHTSQQGEPPHRIIAQSDKSVRWTSRTHGNPHPFLAATSSLILEVHATSDTRLVFEVNGRTFSYPLDDLVIGSRRELMRGWLSEAVHVHRAVPEQAFTFSTTLTDEGKDEHPDVYYLRVMQENQQWAWASPIRVG